ncbi:nitrate- and nitrite sensing domain-containing protein [Streptomyces coeruleoprunus]|uniref:histidine kinase n=1 Tax=Streptomyces coeruleoprunus TaxID=285563 RepID=A0ABV9XCR0_9ACTN
MRFRGKSIRRKIVALLLVPLVSLTGLWGFATFLTGREAGHLMDVGYIVQKVGYPIEDAVRVIQRERRQSLVYLADPRTADALTTLRRERAATDRTLAVIRANARDPRITDALAPSATQRLNSLLQALDGVETLRRSVDTGAVGRIQALEFYNRLIDPCYSFLMALHTLDNVEMDKQGRALVGLARARETLSREDALVVSSLISNRLTAEEIRLISDLVAQRRQFYEVNLELLPGSERETFQHFWRSPATLPLRTAEEAVISGGAGGDRRATDAARWQEAAGSVLAALATRNTEAGDRYQERVEPVAHGVLLKAGIAGVLGFLALLVSVVVSVRIGRALVRDLSRLRKEAQEVSGVRLPSVMRRLAAGEHVDVETEVPHLEYEKDEVGQVGQALNTLQRAAVEAAVKQADMRRGVSEVFVNLARRNQVLLHRQLTLLDTMERRTEDEEELADLFRLDHLTTRMRRHAEGLVILSGAAPSRQWRKPVQLMDVVRAAVAEVEDYERIEVRRLPRIGVGGPAVADLTHLIAELIENATVFSPPHTAVQVLGERVANGFTLEIHDRGLGMSAEDLLDANLRLAETPEFELSDTDRLGLFVVSRLARRQNVRVSLQPSPYGGTTAVVFIPAALLTDAPATEGTGFRLDRQGHDRKGGDRRGGVRNGHDRKGLSQVPSPLPGVGPSVLDGPVELEAPLGLLGELDDADGEHGGLFRPRPPLRPATGLDQHQHEQAADPADQRPAGPVPLPRRKAPTLVARHGRRLDEPGRAHPSPARDDRRAEHPELSGTPGTTGSPNADSTTGTTGIPGSTGSTSNTSTTSTSSTTDPAPEETTLLLRGLPRRVRQASLVPQLREAAERPAAPAAPTSAPGDDDERDAELVRHRMAAMQRGWQRARREKAPGTTPEGDGR